MQAAAKVTEQREEIQRLAAGSEFLTRIQIGQARKPAGWPLRAGRWALDRPPIRSSRERKDLGQRRWSGAEGEDRKFCRGDFPCPWGGPSEGWEGPAGQGFRRRPVTLPGSEMGPCRQSPCPRGSHHAGSQIDAQGARGSCQSQLPGVGGGVGAGTAERRKRIGWGPRKGDRALQVGQEPPEVWAQDRPEVSMCFRQ